MENERRRTAADDSEQGFDKSFGRRLRELRTSRGWSQEHLARQMTEGGTAIHQTQIAKLEAGHRAVRLAEAVALARTLGASLDTLTPSTSTGGDEDQLTPFGKSMERLRELEEIEKDVARAQTALQTREAQLANARQKLEQEIAEVVESRQQLRELEVRSAKLRFRLNQELRQHEKRIDAPEA